MLRLLAAHDAVEVAVITSRAENGRRVDDLFPNLRGHYDLVYGEPDVQVLAACDVVFFATPHNVAMNMVPDILAAGCRVIDLSADYRLRDAGVWSRWYGESHASPDLLAEAVYGLPEASSPVPFSQPGIVTIPLGFVVLVAVSLATRTRAQEMR